MGGRRCRIQGFTLIETVTVIALLAVITTTASVAVVKMLGLGRQARTAALIDQRTRQVMLDLSGELRSAGTVQCRLVPPTSEDGMPTDILMYYLSGQDGDLWHVVRLAKESDEGTGLIKEIRSDLRSSGEPIASEILIPEAVGFRVRCIDGASQSDAAGFTVWVEGTQRGRGPRAYATAVNIPQSLLQSGTRANEDGHNARDSKATFRGRRRVVDSAGRSGDPVYAWRGVRCFHAHRT